MSGNDVTIANLVCDTQDGARTCKAEGPQSMEPQNVRRICNTPTC
jgi:hypothetical protein